MDGKCVRSGVYQPKPQPMENCKPAPKPVIINACLPSFIISILYTKE
jgi:hypothetical protein